MSLNSVGCYAKIREFEKNLPNGNIIATIGTYRYVEWKKHKKFIPDFIHKVLLIDNGERVYTGDFIWIDSFNITNCNEFLVKSQFPSFYITKWHVCKRNGFTKPKKEVEYDNIKKRQRKEIEDAIASEEQDLDEYIEHNGEDDLPM